MSSARTLLIGLGLALVLTVSAGAARKVDSVAVLPNVDVTKLRGDDAEATIAINPTNQLQVFTMVNRMTARRSDDGGQTWVKAGKGLKSICCDNTVAWDDFGNLFLATLNLIKTAPFVTEVPLYLSTDGGASFKKLLDLNTSDAVDQPTIKVGDGMVWVTWNEDDQIVARGAQVTGLGQIGSFVTAAAVPGTKGRVGMPRSVDRQPAPGSGGGNGQFGDIAIGPDGHVVVDWQTSQPDSVSCPCEIDVNTDPDGTGPMGFGSAVKVTDTNVAKFDAIPPQPNRTIDSEANMQYDRSGGAFDGRLYLVYTDAAGPPGDAGNDDTDIYVRYSDDDGATWSSRVKINDDSSGRAQFLPYVAVDQTTGDLVATWYDARNDPTNHDAIEYWGAISHDGGATWSNFQISAGASNGDAGTDSDFEFGDYSWVDFVDGLAMPVWSDNSNSTGDNPDGTGSGLDLYTARIEVGPFCHGRHATITGAGTITGTGGNDVIVGSGGDDQIDAGGGNDVVCAGDGTDTIDDGGGNDTVYGEGGNDTLSTGPIPQGADTFVGGGGTDTVTYVNRTAPISVSLDGKANDGDKKAKETDNIDAENVVGSSSQPNNLKGDADANVLTGGTAKDTLNGGAGADTLNASNNDPGDMVDGGKDKDADVCNVDVGDKVRNCP